MAFENRTKVLLILPQDILDQARVLAGEATTTLKLSVSVQIVLRALIEEGLKRDGDRKVFANIEGQARTVRLIRSLAGRGKGAHGAQAPPRSGIAPSVSGRDGGQRRT